MKRQLRWLLILTILAAFVVWLEPTRVVWGWLRGETFYDGRPTSWWAGELARWDMFHLGMLTRDEMHEIDPHGMVAFERRQEDFFGWVRQLFSKKDAADVHVIGLDDTKGPSLLHGEPDAEPILRSLANHADQNVRRQANYGLRRVLARQNQF